MLKSPEHEKSWRYSNFKFLNFSADTAIQFCYSNLRIGAPEKEQSNNIWNSKLCFKNNITKLFFQRWKTSDNFIVTSVCPLPCQKDR